MLVLTARTFEPRGVHSEEVMTAPAPMSPLGSKMVSVGMDVGLNSLSRIGKLHPASRALMKGVQVTRNIPYTPGGDRTHSLDIYRPTGATGKLPVLLYVHGGGFRILSKESHWMFGYGFAQQGYLVVSINYRLAPTHPFPAAVQDTAQALLWVLDHAEAEGGDLSRLVYAGESAGANLVLAMVIAGAWPRPEAYAQRIFERDPRPKVALPACGMLQVSEAERYLSRAELPAWIRSRIKAVCESYLTDASGDPDRFALADPLVFLENAAPPSRPLPAISAICGTEDPVADDTRRLGTALQRFDMPSEAPFYEGGGHAFHAFIWQEAAKKAWADQLAFLKTHLG